MQWRNGFPRVDATNQRILIHYRTRFLAYEGSLLHAPNNLPEPVAGMRLQAVGYLGEQAIFLLQLSEWPEYPTSDLGYEWVSARDYIDLFSPDFYQMLSYASQIGTWSLDHQFCGRCGTPMRQQPDERLMLCLKCNNHQYPRISPSMIVLVTDGDKLLLARGKRFKNRMYSVLAGFAEPAESIEECVVREVREEVALEVTNLRYITSQSWPFPHSLMFGFIADYAGGEIDIQEDELLDARWYAWNQLPQIPDKGTISRYLIDYYLAELTGKTLTNPVLPR